MWHLKWTRQAVHASLMLHLDAIMTWYHGLSCIFDRYITKLSQYDICNAVHFKYMCANFIQTNTILYAPGDLTQTKLFNRQNFPYCCTLFLSKSNIGSIPFSFLVHFLENSIRCSSRNINHGRVIDYFVTFLRQQPQIKLVVFIPNQVEWEW